MADQKCGLDMQCAAQASFLNLSGAVWRVCFALLLTMVLCFVGKRPKKGMATAKQRLGKILKLNRNGHARFFV